MDEARKDYELSGNFFKELFSQEIDQLGYRNLIEKKIGSLFQIGTMGLKISTRLHPYFVE